MRPTVNRLVASIFVSSLLQIPSAVEAVTYSEKVLHSFNYTDGEWPYAGVTDLKGTLYGTTLIGGGGIGAVFSLDVGTGTEKILYSFTAQDGEGGPESRLIDLRGTLYGTTVGEEDGQGDVFALNLSSDTERMIHLFCSELDCADGENPNGVIEAGGKLYGTAFRGGTSGVGTLFAMNRKFGYEKVLHTFCSETNCTDGANPEAAPIYVNGMLYGTASEGGYANCIGGVGCGTVYSFDLSTSVFTVLYTFCALKNCADGATPSAGLIEVNGTLYGTTSTGGTFRGGTIFAVNPTTGEETVAYSFCNQRGCPDGSTPMADLIDVNGVVYGTTSRGGSGEGGTVFSFDPATGVETVLYAFCSQTNCVDGYFPVANVTEKNGKLYGTTIWGGSGTSCGDTGCGVVFELKPNR